jgi:hypothetical protein
MVAGSSVQGAVLVLAAGDSRRFVSALVLAQQDWRDFLVAAGLANGDGHNFSTPGSPEASPPGHIRGYRTM